MVSLADNRRRPRPMNVFIRHGSPAEDTYYALAGIPGLEPEQIVPGIPPAPAHDLMYHGGKTIQHLTFTNCYVGSGAWQSSDVENIDRALSAAMSEPTLNNVMAQYFSAVPTAAFKRSRMLAGAAPGTMSQGDVEQLVTTLAGTGAFDGFDLASSVFNFMLPRGTILNDNPQPSPASAQGDVDSLHGLGGYHGSVQISGQTLYYAVGVYSETSNGQTNGIPVFDAPWKNVVATFYHELNEARTDPDVERVIQGGPSSLLGWTSRQGEECGDFPVVEANPLSLVFQEVPLTSGGSAPVQFQYSDYVHGPEGPVATPDPPAPRPRAKIAEP